MGQRDRKPQEFARYDVYYEEVQGREAKEGDWAYDDSPGRMQDGLLTGCRR